MVIEEEDFRMEYCEGGLWDLELLHTIRPKGKPERNEFKNEAYGLPTVTCMKRIINYRLGKKKDVYTLKEYVQDYKYQIDLLNKLFKDM